MNSNVLSTRGYVTSGFHHFVQVAEKVSIYNMLGNGSVANRRKIIDEEEEDEQGKGIFSSQLDISL